MIAISPDESGLLLFLGNASVSFVRIEIEKRKQEQKLFGDQIEELYLNRWKFIAV